MGPPQPDPPIPTSIGTASGPSGTKKKFGKNLNRLVGPSTAPPPPSSRSSSAPSSGGLAFLSTKKTSISATAAASSSVRAAKSGGGATGAASAATVVAASRPKSAHDALLTAAAAEAGLVAIPKPKEKEKDAWGTVQERRAAVENRERFEKQREEEQKRREVERRTRTRAPLLPPGAGRSQSSTAASGDDGEEGTHTNSDNTAAAAAADNTASGEEPQEQHQSTAMAKLARVRAERRKAEEEERYRKQREGAARRLKELEEKMGGGGAGGGGASGSAAAAAGAAAAPPVRGLAAANPAEVENWRRRSTPQQLATQIRLERLGSKAATDGGGKGGGAASPPGRMSIMAKRAAKGTPLLGSSSSSSPSGRALWDPTTGTGRTFSSLVGGSSTGVVRATSAGDDAGGGGGGGGGGDNDREEQQKRHHGSGSSPLDDKNEYSRGEGSGTGGGASNRDLVLVDEYSRGGGDRRSNSNASDYDRYAYEEPPPPTEHVIHLDSYETTDRGEPQRKTEAPRMLFDPKSGSMVAAKDLPAGSGGAGGGGGGGGGDRGGKSKKERGRKERKSKGQGGGADPSDRLLLRRSSDADDAADSGGRSARRGKKERSSKRGGGKDQAAEESSRRGGARGGRSQPKLPRTCGVLYKRDDRGRYVCADGCDADQGYGAHSVPGGRVRNPSGHAAFVKEHNRLHGEAAAYRSSRGHFANGSPMGYTHGQHQDAYMAYDANGYDYGGKAETEEVAPEVPLVRADEDLKLIVGEDSPTLKPSAREFAPRHAALAAPSVPGTNKKSANDADAKDKEEKDIDDVAAGFAIDGIIGSDDEDEDEAHAVGLGFDPTLNMDSVMMSPAGSPSKGNVDAEPFALALGQMAVVETEDVGGSPRMPFSSRMGKKADGSRILGKVSTAWSLSAGAEKSDGGNAFAASTFSNWGLRGNAAGADDADTNAADGEAGKEQSAASFLSLSTKLGSPDDASPWGTSFGGLGGLGAKKADG